MATFNISFYLTNIQKGMTTLTTNQKISDAILGRLGSEIKNIIDPSDMSIINFGSGKLSQLMKHKVELDREIVENLGNTDVLELLDEIFEDDIQSDINDSLISDACNIINNCAQNEPSLSDSSKRTLENLLANEDYAGFLEQAFIKSCVASNIEPDPILDIDGLYLTEVKMKCPLCGANLIKRVRGHDIKKFKITKIYDDDFSSEIKSKMKKPSKLDGDENNIALCEDCNEIYTSSWDIETYNSLCSIKDAIQENKQLQKELEKFDVETELDKIIMDLGSLSTLTISSFERMDAVEVKKKIEKSNGTLFNNIVYNVTTYYKYLRDRFSQLEAEGFINFKVIKRNIHFAYETLADIYCDQNKIHSELVKWLQDKLRLPDEKYALCKIIIDFFVQDCEVFYEIS